jgi:hypothetical protein
MKKTIGKPENWQDFESLCKKLWGEIWEIPNLIKKNGRLGQDQSGVDVYGIPKNKDGYWGIQCKGKDEYSNAKLTPKDIDNEIEKAKLFLPKLDVYIIATTANKDSRLEEYVRLKDLEIKNNTFELHLFCWEDIADFIEENRNTYNWYLNNISYKDKFDLKVLFNELEEHLIIEPKIAKLTKKHKFTNKTSWELINQRFQEKFEIPEYTINSNIYARSSRINKSWVDFDIVLFNSGTRVLEDWRFVLKFSSGVKNIYDELNEPFGTNFKLRTTYVSDESKTIKYYPLNNSPLIQKDNVYFHVSILSDYSEKITADWEILARDFDTTGTFEILVEPQYIEKTEIIEVNKLEEITADEVIYSDYIIDKKDDISSG